MAQLLLFQLVTAYLLHKNLVIYHFWQAFNVELTDTAVPRRSATRNVNIPHSTTFVIPDRAGRRAGADVQWAALRNGGAKTGLRKRDLIRNSTEKAAVAQHDKIVYSSINVNFIERFTSMW